MMDSWKKGLATLIGLGCLGITPLSRAQSTPTPTPYVYPEDAVNEILKNCREETETFLPPDLIEPLCECVLTEFQAQFSHSEYQKLIAEAEKKREDPLQFLEIGQQCAVQLF